MGPGSRPPALRSEPSTASPRNPPAAREAGGTVGERPGWGAGAPVAEPVLLLHKLETLGLARGQRFQAVCVSDFPVSVSQVAA